MIRGPFRSFRNRLCRGQWSDCLLDLHQLSLWHLSLCMSLTFDVRQFLGRLSNGRNVDFNLIIPYFQSYNFFFFFMRRTPAELHNSVLFRQLQILCFSWKMTPLSTLYSYDNEYSMCKIILLVKLHKTYLRSSAFPISRSEPPPAQMRGPVHRTWSAYILVTRIW